MNVHGRYAVTTVYVLACCTAGALVALGALAANIAMLGVLIVMSAVCCWNKP